MPLTPTTWRNSQTVNITTAGTQNQADIAQLTNGNILVTWTSYSDTGAGSPTGGEVLGQLYSPMGTRIGSEFIINAVSTVDDERDSSIVALPGGGFIVIYHDDDFQAIGGSNITLEEFTAAGTPIAENALVVQDSGAGGFPNYYNPRGAASSDTSVLVTYEKATSTGVSGIFGKIYNPVTNTYSAELSIITAQSNTAAESAVLSNGNYAIVANRTVTGGGGDSSLVFRILDATGANVLAQTVVADTDTNAAIDTEVSITSLVGGGFVLAWSTVAGTDIDVAYKVYSNAGVEVGSGIAGSTSLADSNNEPAVTSLTDGSFVIVYDDDVNDTVHATHFSAAGVNLGDFIFATAGTDIAVTSLADGRFAATYLSEGGEIQIEILDTRDAPNAVGVYAPNQWQVGTVGNDLFTAAANVKTVRGHTGNDTITDALGAHTIFGDGGADRINVIGTIDNDAYYGGSGSDFINWSANTAGNGIVFNLASGTAVLGAASEVMHGFEHLIGTNGNDRIIGTTAANNLFGGAGNDIIDGGSGNDFLDGGTGINMLTGGAGNDTYVIRAAGTLIVEGVGGGTTDSVFASVSFALAADDNIERMQTTLTAGTGAINLTGNALGQQIFGNAGANRLDGKGGNDTLTGGAGADVFVFTSTLGAGNVDRIVGYSGPADQIEIDNAVFTGMIDNNLALAASAFTANLTGLATLATQRIIYETDTGFLFFDQDGTGGVAARHFATVTIGTALAASEFTVI